MGSVIGESSHFAEVSLPVFKAFCRVVFSVCSIREWIGSGDEISPKTDVECDAMEEGKTDSIQLEESGFAENTLPAFDVLQ
jgi:hypothetical protein